jgi:hypothetical protein
MQKNNKGAVEKVTSALLPAAAFRFDVHEYASAKRLAAPRICNFLNSLIKSPFSFANDYS